MAIGEVLFLLWGIRVCYNVRNAESLYNEAKLISYAIYNIAFVNMLMVAIQWVLLKAIGNNLCQSLFPSCEQNFYFLLAYLLSGREQQPSDGNTFIDIPHVTSFLMSASSVTISNKRCRNWGNKRNRKFFWRKKFPFSPSTPLIHPFSQPFYFSASGTRH